MVYEVLKQYELTYLFGAATADYCIGDTKDREQELIQHILTFEQGMTEAEARETDLFKFMIGKTKVVADFEELGKTDPMFAELDRLCKANNGLWNPEAEAYLLANAKAI